jgi:hypothetical protein
VVGWYEARTATLRRGFLAEQAALHGLLARIRNLGVPLPHVEQIDCLTR